MKFRILICLLLVAGTLASNTLIIQNYNYTLKVTMADSETIQFEATVLDQMQLVIGIGKEMANTEMIAFYSNGASSYSIQGWSTGYTKPLQTADSDNNIKWSVESYKPGQSATLKVTRKLSLGNAQYSTIPLNKNQTMIFSTAAGTDSIHKHAG